MIKANEIWETTSIKDLLSSQIGGLWGSPKGESEIDVKVARVTELKPNGGLDLSTAVTRSITQKQLSSRKLERGDILLEKSGGGPNQPVGRVGLVEELDYETICSNFMLLMKPNSEIVDSRYLWLFLVYLHTTGQTIPLQTSTTNIRNINTTDYLNTVVKLPPLKAQLVIVEKLTGLLAKLDIAASKLENAESKIRNSLSAFLHEIDISSATEKGWEIATLGEHAEKPQYGWTTSGKAHGSSKLLRTTDIIREELDWNQVPFCENVPANIEQFLLKDGDIVISRTGAGVGSSRLIVSPPQGAVFASYLIRVRLKQSILPDFVSIFLKSPGYWRQISEQKAGSAISNINVPKIQDLKLCIPPLEVQRDLVTKFHDLESKVLKIRASLYKSRAQIEDLRHAVLHSAFTGKLSTEENND